MIARAGINPSPTIPNPFVGGSFRARQRIPHRPSRAPSNPPAAANRGRRPRWRGGWWSAIGHSLVTVGHKPRSGAVRTRIQPTQRSRGVFIAPLRGL
jgi:hypothetical protein